MTESQEATRRLVKTGFGGLVPWSSFHIVFMHHVRTDMRFYRRYDLDKYDMLEIFQINHRLNKRDVFNAAEHNDIEASSDIMRVLGLRHGRSEGAVV